MRGRPFVYVPDAPTGPFAHNFRPVHSRKRRGDRNPVSLHRFFSDANLLWTAQLANRTFPRARWIFAIDVDAFVFERTLRMRAQTLDSRQPVVVGLLGNGAAHVFPVGGLVSRNKATCESSPFCTTENGDGNFYAYKQPRGLRGCCMCPVVKRIDGSYAYHPNGTAFYWPPPFDPYGGTGMLLSKGLLDAIPPDAWALCARRLVCGSADFRLSACVANLLNGTRFVRMHENYDYMHEALKTSIEPPQNVYYNVYWSTIHKDPVRGPLILDLFRKNTSCPWAMHKLHLKYAEPVFDMAQHCM